MELWTLISIAFLMLTISFFIKYINDKNTYYSGLGGKTYNKPVPTAMRDEQALIFREVMEEQDKLGKSPSESCDYAIKIATSLDPKLYGLKEKPFPYDISKAKCNN